MYNMPRDKNILKNIFRKHTADNIEITNSLKPSEISEIKTNCKKKINKVLIVDDASINRYVLKKYIERIDKNIISLEAETGMVCLEILKHHDDIDIIFLDLIMPGISGLDTTIEIRKYNKSIIIYGVTGQIESREKLLSIGMNGVFFKPLNYNELKNIFYN